MTGTRLMWRLIRGISIGSARAVRVGLNSGRDGMWLNKSVVLDWFDREVGRRRGSSLGGLHARSRMNR